MKNAKDIKISIIEDDSFIRESLRLFIENAEGFSVKGAFPSAELALKKLRDGYVDVLLLDIDLPGISGIEAISKFKDIQEDVNIVILTVHDESEIVFSALEQGAVGYLLKGINSSHLLKDIRDVYNGGAPMSPSVARRVISSFKRKSKVSLSDRELEVLQKLSSGTNNKQIADELFVSPNTIKAHIKNIYKKMHVHSRTEAVSKAIKNRWI